MALPEPWMSDVSRGAYVKHLQTIRVTDRQIATILKDAAQEAERIVAQTLGNPANVSQAVRRSQYASSLQALRDAQGELWGSVTRATREGMGRAALLAEEAHMEMLSILGRAVDADEAAMLMNSMNGAARAAAGDVRSRLLNNIPLSDKVYRTQQLSQGWVDKAVNRGIATQKSAREIARDVRGMIRPDVRGGVSYAANRLARTEISDAFHATDVRQAQSLPWIDGMKWEVSGSHPRPDICDDLAEDDSDGLGSGVYRPPNVPNKPHPQCLCHLITVTVQPEDFNAALMSGAYDDWLMSQGYLGIGA